MDSTPHCDDHKASQSAAEVQSETENLLPGDSHLASHGQGHYMLTKKHTKSLSYQMLMASGLSE